MTRISYPFKGMSEALSPTDQPPLTTPLARNMRGRHPVTQRLQGASRGGFSPFHTGGPLAAAPVKRIQQVVYDVTRQTYASLGDAGVLEWSKAGPTLGSCRGTVRDAQNNVYALDGNSGLAKFNADGFQLWKIALPCADGTNIVRALCVDPDTGFIYCGVSAEGKPETARLWTYRQKDDNETELVEQIEPGGFTEAIVVYQREIYALQNFPQRGRAYVQVYGAINSGVLEPGKQWEVPYPANDLAVSPKDGTVFVASDANTQRGLDPRSPGSTTTSEDFQLKDLANIDKRLWSHFDARDRTSLAIERLSEESGDDDGEVVQWNDLSKNGRHWYANQGISAWPAVPPGESGPTYKSSGINGFPSISFSGAAYNGSGTAASVIKGQTMVGVAASSTDRSHRAEQRSPLPTYKGAQFALFMVFKAGIDDNIRGLLNIPTPTSGSNRFRGVTINRRNDDNLPGTIPMPGSVYLVEVGSGASDTGQSTPDASGWQGATGPNRPPCGGLSGSGLCILTWICDGGVHDGNAANGGTGTSTRSVLRINGHPVDRWQSAAFSTTEAITLGIAYLGSSGHSRFAGQIGEMIVLSDWYDQSGVQQRLITCPTYPDSAWSANGDTEVERIEGYLAHKWGLAHELATGQAAWLKFNGNPTAGESITIDGKTYTFQSSLGAANDVLRGATLRESASNLYAAINRIGSPGVDYDQRTEKHSTFLARAAVDVGSSVDTVLTIQSISPYAARVTLANSANMVWLAGNTQHTIAGAGEATGWYPHPFTLKKTTNSRGGPPANATNTQAQISPQYLLQSIYPMLSKWQPTTGRPTWVATSGYDVVASVASNKITTAGTGLGGVGFGVRIGSEGQVFSCGPRRAVVSGDESIIADAIDLRKFGDTGATFTTADGALGDPWGAALFNAGSTPNALVYAYPRMDTDEFDNIYLPISYTQTGGAADPYAGVSVVGYRDASTGVAAGVEFMAYESLPNDQEAYSVTVDQRHPTFPTGDTVQHAEFIYLGTEPFSSDTAKLSVFKVRLISTTNAAGSNRAHALLAVCNGNVYKLTLNGAPALVTGGTAALDSAAPFIDSCELFGKIYFCDGKRVMVYDPKTDTIAAHTSETAGIMPLRAQLLASWRGRLVLLAFKDNPHNWAMSEKDNPKGWDMFPFTINDAQAIQGVDSEVGLSPDIIRAFVALSDDLAIFFGDHSIYRMQGDPATPGAQFHPISHTIGAAFGRSVCKDPEGRVYFFSNTGGLYVIDPAGLSVKPVTEQSIPARLAAVDLALYRVELAWSDKEHGLRIAVVSVGAGGTLVDSYFIERLTNTGVVEAPYLDTYADDAVQPTCMATIDADDPDDRRLLIGCEDGEVRYYNPAALNDDGFIIDSRVRWFPLVPEASESEWMVTDLEILTQQDDGGPNWFLYASDVADERGQARAHGRVRSGRAPMVKARVRGAVLGLELGLASLTERWSLESLSVRLVEMGRKAGFLA